MKRKGVGGSDKEAKKQAVKELNRKKSEKRSVQNQIQSVEAKIQRLKENQKVAESCSIESLRLNSFLDKEVGSLSDIQGPPNATDSLSCHGESKSV